MNTASTPIRAVHAAVPVLLVIPVSSHRDLERVPEGFHATCNALR